MENAETPVRSSRPRPWLLVALGLAIVAFVATWFWPTSSAVPGAPTSNQPRTRGRQGVHAVDPAELNVRLEALNTARPEPGDVERNPFRFQTKAPPPPPNAGRPGGGAAPAGPPPAPPLPTVPPIPLKFIGIVERAEILPAVAQHQFELLGGGAPVLGRPFDVGTQPHGLAALDAADDFQRQFVASDIGQRPRLEQQPLLP